MSFFAELTGWLNRVLGSYIAENTERIAVLLEPLVVSFGVLYTLVWGYLQLTGKIDEPLTHGIKRILVLALILGLSLQLWMYNELIVNSFFVLPGELGARLVGRFEPAEIIDGLLATGSDVADSLVSRGSIFNDDITFYFAAGLVYLASLLTALYAIFLLSLSRIALSVLLAIGPFFIALLFFDTTRRFFESWVAQLANYALISVLTTLVAALMMRMALATAQSALIVGGSIEVVHAARFAVAAGLTFLVMRQVMPMAAGLASGLALSTFGVVSAGLRWGLGKSSRSLGQFARGLSDSQTTRWDSLSRKAGHLVRQGVVGAARALGRRENYVRRTW